MTLVFINFVLYNPLSRYPNLSLHPFLVCFIVIVIIVIIIVVVVVVIIIIIIIIIINIIDKGSIVVLCLFLLTFT